jgi:hypothetical protein
MGANFNAVFTKSAQRLAISFSIGTTYSLDQYLRIVVPKYAENRIGLTIGDPLVPTNNSVATVILEVIAIRG